MTWLELTFWTTFCLAMEAFFSGSELALVSANKLQITHQALSGKRGARMALYLAHRPELFFSATLLGQHLFIVANSIFVTFFIYDRFGVEYEFFGLLLSPLILIFGEAVPKTLAQQWADRMAPFVAPVILVVSYIFYPVVWPLSKFTQLLLGGIKSNSLKGHEVTRESLEVLLKESEIPKNLSPVFKKSILRILAFSRKHAHDIMTPLVEVISLRDNAAIQEAISLCSEEEYSIVPIFHKKSDNIVGMVTYLRLLMAENLQAPVSTLMMTPVYAPREMGVKDLFVLLRETRQNFAVVVDEYGGAIGVVTLEDILEELVGEIQDEFDEEVMKWKKIGRSQYLFQGRASIDEINERLRWRLPKDNYETLSGFLLKQLGHIPKSGETLHFGHLTFLVKAATARSIDEVLVEVEG